MQIHASTKSKAMKRGADKAIAKAAGVDCDLRDMVGSLHLDATNGADLSLLRALYNHVFCQWIDHPGSIIVKDGAGKEVCNFFYQKRDEATAPTGEGPQSNPSQP